MLINNSLRAVKRIDFCFHLIYKDIHNFRYKKVFFFKFPNYGITQENLEVKCKRLKLIFNYLGRLRLIGFCHSERSEETLDSKNIQLKISQVIINKVVKPIKTFAISGVKRFFASLRMTVVFIKNIMRQQNS